MTPLKGGASLPLEREALKIGPQPVRWEEDPEKPSERSP